ncbi:MAG: cytochrome c biogenesis protein [Chthoniobacter sp.]|nr:cytochrome c biogenesis protein [Chthoniobacter sp.]
MDHLPLAVSTFCFLVGFAYTMHALGARVYRASRLNLVAILGGFVGQTVFLYLRGQALGRCPLTNRFEVLIFLSWALVLFYLLIGPAYRLSLLGAFTSPLVFLFQTGALLLVGDVPSQPKLALNGWLELHAAISVVAYGAFALACVAGVMYLVQERQLKTHHLHSIFYHLPPIRDLAVANARLIIAGFALLTIGLGAGFKLGSVFTHSPLTAWSVVVWLGYGGLAALGGLQRISQRRVAWMSVAAFGGVLVTLAGLRFVTENGAL